MISIGIVVMNPESYLAFVEDQDTPLLLEALERAGAHAEAISWHDPAADWSELDLAVLRTPWDYSQQPTTFDAWLQQTAARTTVLNPPELVRWNMDKRYLADLEADGITVVPTSYHDEESSLRAALADHAGHAGRAVHAGHLNHTDENAVHADDSDHADHSDHSDHAGHADEHIVLKPSVSAGSRHTGLFAADDPTALELGREILDSGRTVMLQPEVPELSAGREKAVYAIEGHHTHAIAKGALLARGGGLRGGDYEEDPHLVAAEPAERAFAEEVLTATTRATGLGMPLYARIDMVDTAQHGLVLLEAELIEPSLNLPLAPEVADTLAEAIVARARSG